MPAIDMPAIDRVFAGLPGLALGLALVAGPALAAEPAAPTLSEPGRQAMERLQAGDAAGALAVLEPAHKAGRSSAVDRSLLGSIYLELTRPGDALAVLRPLADAEQADPAVLYTAGRAAREVGDLVLAAGYLERSIAIVPRSPAMKELGMLRAAQGRPLVAYRMLRSWVQLQPADGEGRAAAAALALQLERPAEAEELLTGLDASDPRVGLLVGQLLIEKGDPRGALGVLEPLVPSHPAAMTFDLFRLVADAYIQTGRAADAVTLLEGGPKGPRLALLYAEALHRTGDVDGALEALRPLAEPLLATERRDDTGTRPIALEYGRLLVAAGKGALAIPYLELATTLEPNDPVGWKSLADARMAAGRLEEAKQALARFRELSEADTTSRRQEALTRKDPLLRALVEANAAMERGEHEQALGRIRRELALDPDTRLRILEARCLLALGRADEMKAIVARLAERQGGEPDVLYLQGVVRLISEDRPGAEKLFRQAIAKAPEHVAALSDLAVIARVDGRKDEARQLLQRILELHPEDKATQAALAGLDGSG